MVKDFIKILVEMIELNNKSPLFCNYICPQNVSGELRNGYPCRLRENLTPPSYKLRSMRLIVGWLLSLVEQVLMSLNDGVPDMALESASIAEMV